MSAHRASPVHDERFIGYGYDRKSQICELHIAGYKFNVLNNEFLVHQGMQKLYALNVENNIIIRGFKHRRTISQANELENMKNWQLFNYHFKDEIQRKYSSDISCTVNEPLSEIDVPSGPQAGVLKFEPSEAR